jgi:hypothetical protein
MTKLEDYLPLDGLGGTYSEEQARQAIANAEAAASINPGGVNADFGTKIDDATIPTGGEGNIGWLSAIWKLITDRLPTLVGGKIPVDVASLNVTVDNANLEISNDVGNPIPVSGTFWQATQPVSATSLPLPSGAATSALQSTSNTSLANIDTKTPALGQALASASTPVVLPASQITALTPPTSVGISGTLPAFAATPTVNIGTTPAGLAYLSTATITRAANTTAYTANDVYGSAFELTNIGASGGFIFLNSLDIIFNITSLPSGMGSFAIYLYSSPPPSAITDNLPYSLNSGDRSSILTLNGFNLFASLARGGGSVVAESFSINQLFKLAPGSTSLWGYLVTTNAFTPAANSETATIRARSFAP